MLGLYVILGWQQSYHFSCILIFQYATLLRYKSKFKNYVIFVKFAPPALESRLKKTHQNKKSARKVKTYVIFVRCVPRVRSQDLKNSSKQKKTRENSKLT